MDEISKQEREQPSGNDRRIQRLLRECRASAAPALLLLAAWLAIAGLVIWSAIAR